MKAGERFVCVCCKEPHDEQEATMDAQFAGPVCEECRRNTLWATAYLKQEGIDRPFDKSDIDNFNFNRIKNFYA